MRKMEFKMVLNLRFFCLKRFSSEMCLLIFQKICSFLSSFLSQVIKPFIIRFFFCFTILFFRIESIENLKRFSAFVILVFQKKLVKLLMTSGFPANQVESFFTDKSFVFNVVFQIFLP